MYIKYTILEWKSVREFISDARFYQNDDFLRKYQKQNKKRFFGQKFLWQANKNSFASKMPKFVKNHV